MPLSLDEWIDAAPRLETDHDTLAHTYRRSLVDLAALQFRPLERLEGSLPAAGAPLLVLRTLLGLDIDNEQLTAQPHLPAPLDVLRLRGVPVRGRHEDVG